MAKARVIWLPEKDMALRLAFAALGLALLSAGACSSGAPQSARPQIPLTEIVAACGGGFTGGSEGVTIQADDHIVSWEQASSGADRSERDLGPDPTFAADVRRQLQQITFGNIDFSERGDMTCWLRSGDHEVSWAQGREGNAPPEVLDIHLLVYGVESDEE